MWLTIPNLFTALRILMTPFILYELARGRFLVGGWLFGAAAVTDLLDGAVARQFKAESNIGLYLDPVADKILLTSIYIGLAMAGAVPLWLVVIIFGRDLLILSISAIALQFTGFRDLNPSVWGKASTFFQVMTAVCVMAARGYGDTVLGWICTAMFWIVAVLAAISASDYVLRGVLWLRHRPRTVDLRIRQE